MIVFIAILLNTILLSTKRGYSTANGLPAPLKPLKIVLHAWHKCR